MASTKKIGVLFGQENSFPQAVVDRINSKKPKNIVAELAHMEEVVQGKSCGYAVLIDRISQDVPYYRAALKNAAITGTAVVNNPFWWSADEKFFNNSLAEAVGVPVPKTVLLPSKNLPDDTTADSFRNMKYPLDWEMIIEHLGGFPLYMKPHSGGGWKSVYQIKSFDELWEAHGETDQLVMMLQEEIHFDSYFRCYYIDGDRVKLMPYEPRNPHHLRYLREPVVTDKKLLKTIEKYVLKLNHALGYDFNTVEFAVKDGIPYAIDFCNPAPDADINSVGEENFEWVIENVAEMAIERAEKQKNSGNNLTWGSFIKKGIKGDIPK